MSSRYERSQKKLKKEKTKKRKKLAKILVTLLIIVSIFILIWGKFIEPNILTTNDEKIINQNIPENFNNLKIVHFSDLHYGTSYNEHKLEKLIEKINNYKPDILVFSGDLIDKQYKANEKDIKTLIEYLSKLESKLGKYAVIGNHDYYNDNYENIMYDSNFTVLKNNYDTIYYKENKPILIYGLDNITYGKPRLDTLNMENIDNIAYKIILLHEPDYIDEFVNNYDVNLILAGHSHNGQINIPKIKEVLLPPGSKTYYEKYYKANNTDIYISNGVGNSTYDFRLFTPPSINIYRLNQN